MDWQAIESTLRSDQRIKSDAYREELAAAVREPSRACRAVAAGIAIALRGLAHPAPLEVVEDNNGGLYLAWASPGVRKVLCINRVGGVTFSREVSDGTAGTAAQAADA